MAKQQKSSAQAHKLWNLCDKNAEQAFLCFLYEVKAGMTMAWPENLMISTQLV